MKTEVADQRNRDESFMAAALEQARAAAARGEVPIGAVVVADGRIVSRAHNRRELDHDPSAHAEFSAIVAAARELGRWRLPDCTVYVTLEPCPMCAGLMLNARIGRCVYGAPDPKAGALGTLYRLHEDPRLNHRFEVAGGVLADVCSQELRSFFVVRRGARVGASALEADRLHATDRAASRASDVEAVESRRVMGGGETMVPPLPAPRILLAMDSFKGSATSEQVEEWASEGIRRALPDARITCLPIADGGEGTVAAVQRARGGELASEQVAGPLGTPVTGSFLMRGDTAVIEMSSVAGLMLSGRTRADAQSATTRGVGELVLRAVDRGAKTIYLGLGGSATNDGGAGFLRALGARLVDRRGNDVPAGLAGLERLDAVDLAPAVRRLSGTRLIGLTDVKSPLVGKTGAIRVFGPQKGLVEGLSVQDAEAELERCDRWMIRYAELLDEARAGASRYAPAASGCPRPFRRVAGVPGAGAAGGLGAAVLAVGGELRGGIDAVLDLVGFDEAAARADLVVTGEGRMDAQSAQSKAPVGVARRAKQLGKPVVAIVGGRDEDLGPVYALGIDLVLPAVREPMALERAMSPEEARGNLACAGEAVARAFALGRAPRSAGR